MTKKSAFVVGVFIIDYDYASLCRYIYAKKREECVTLVLYAKSFRPKASKQIGKVVRQHANGAVATKHDQMIDRHRTLRIQTHARLGG